MPTRCNRVFIEDLTACSTCFRHHYAHHQELKSIIHCLLPVVFGAVVFKLLVWCGAEGYVSCLQDANMFRAPLYPSSGSQDYYKVVAACGISCCGFQVVGLLWSWGLCVVNQHPANRTHNTHQNNNPKTTVPNTTGNNHCIILLSSWW